jgi:uncharacterized membrane protein
MKLFKRFAVTILGVALLAVGVALMILPGPGIVLIVAGLAVLATEYVWARALLVKAKRQAESVQQAAVASPLRTAGSVIFALGMVAVGALTFLIDNVSWPVLDQQLDKAWGPFMGTVLVVMGLVLLVTTVLTIKAARGEDTTYTGPPLRPSRAGATRLDQQEG